MMRRRTAKVADSSSIDGSEDAFVLTGDAVGDTADDGVVEVSSIGQLTLITESHTRQGLRRLASKHAAEKEAASEAVSQHVIISLLKTRKSHRHMTMEGFVYVLWLGVYFSIIILHRNPSQSFLIEEAVRQQLFERRTTQLGISFAEVKNLDDTWEWLEDVLLPATDQRDFYNGDAVPPNLRNTIHYQSKIVAGIRLVQRRGKANAGGLCFDTGFEQLFNIVCLSDEEDQQNFGPGGDPSFTFRTVQGASGFIEFLATRQNSDQLNVRLDDLKTKRWLDERTRSLDISMTLYNSNYKEWIFASMTLDYDRSGYVAPSSSVLLVPVDSYNFDYTPNIVRLVLEIIFTLALVFFILEEFYQLYYVHESNFKSYFFAGKYAPLGRIIESVQAPSKQSNRSRWLSIILNIMVVAFWLTFIFNEERQRILGLADDTAEPDTNVSVESLTATNDVFIQLNAFNFIICTLRLIKYFRMTPGGERLIKTIMHAAPMLLWFLPVYLTMLVCFAFIGFILFGTQLESWSTFAQAFYRVWEMNYGLYDTNELYGPGGLVGQFFTYIVTVSLVVLLLNALLAIIVIAWETLSTETEAPTSMSEFWTTLKMPAHCVSRAMDIVAEQPHACTRAEFISVLSKSGDISKKYILEMCDWVWHRPKRQKQHFSKNPMSSVHVQVEPLDLSQEPPSVTPDSKQPVEI